MITDAELEAVHTFIFRLETRWLPEEQPDTTNHHAYDSLPFWLFLEGIRPAIELASGKRFLDIGCGIGSKLAIMKQLGFDVAGIERFGPYAETARTLMDGQAEIVHANALDLDVFDADLVYMYRPMKSDEDEDRLEQHVRERVTAGTVLFFPTRSEVTVA